MKILLVFCIFMYLTSITGNVVTWKFLASDDFSNFLTHLMIIYDNAITFVMAGEDLFL